MWQKVKSLTSDDKDTLHILQSAIVYKVKWTINSNSFSLTWIGWREHLSCFVVSSFVLISINSEGAQTVLPIGLAISHTNPGVLLIRNELIRPNESGLSDIGPEK